MYCKRCKKEVGGFHRCFFGPKAIIASKKAPNIKKSISFRLLERLRTYKGVPEITEDAYIERLYPGNDDRSKGAWLWAVANNGICQIGSCHTMQECLLAKTWEIYRPYDWFEIIIK
jgi:hypothetical protein